MARIDDHAGKSPESELRPPTRRVGVGDRAIAYWDCGDGHPVVFVHGNFASKRWFREQVVNPPPGYRFVALDLPNFGESDPLGEDATLENYAAALHGFANALELDSFALVAHSMGGAVAQTYALAHPDRVERLFLVSSPPPSGFPTPAGTAAAQQELRASKDVMGTGLAATMPTRKPDDFDAIVDDAFGMSPDLYEPHNETLAAMDLAQDARSFGKPVWILFCALDYLITEAMAHGADDTYPKTRLVVWDDVGHSPQVEDPKRFRALLERFLEGSP